MSGENPQDRRSFVALPLAQLLPRLTRPAYRKRSPAGALLMSEWASIVGTGLAAETEPRRLSGGQLTIACAGPMALQLQHLAGSLIERINTHAGQIVVERLRFVQDRVAAPPAPPARRPPVAAEPADWVRPGALNDALSGLLAAIRDRESER
jgi:hypothetical protein